jgi:hypothetical protein
VADVQATSIEERRVSERKVVPGARADACRFRRAAEPG